MGKNTPDRQEFIISNLKVELNDFADNDSIKKVGKEEIAVS